MFSLLRSTELEQTVRAVATDADRATRRSRQYCPRCPRPRGNGSGDGDALARLV